MDTFLMTNRFYISQNDYHWKPLNTLNRLLTPQKDQIILLMGEACLQKFVNKKGLKYWRGTFIENNGTTYLPTWSIKDLYKNPALEFEMLCDLKRFKQGPQPLPQYTTKVNEFDLPFVPATLAIDIETEENEIVSIGFCTKTLLDPQLHTFVFTPSYFDIAKKLYSESSSHIYHNAYFDLSRLIKAGFTTNATAQDTMLQAHILYPHLPKGLQYWSSIINPWHKAWKNEKDDDLFAYNAMDVLVTHEIYHALHSKLNQKDLLNQYFHLTKRLNPYINAYNQGICEIPNKRTSLIESLNAETNALLTEMQNFTSNPKFNPRSIVHLKNAFKTIKAPKSRKTGTASFNKKSLQIISLKYKDFNEFCQMIEEFRAKRSLIDNFLTKKPFSDGKMRTSYNLAGAETYRLSSSAESEIIGGRGMNLQNAPPKIKELFCPSPDHLFIEIDLERADAQIVAWDCNDESLKTAFRNRDDIHYLNARSIFGPDATPEHRQLAKTACHAANYGVSPKTLAQSLSITPQEAKDFLNAWFQAHPQIAEWHHQIRTNLIKELPIQNIYGFRRSFPTYSTTLLSKALGWIGQSTVAITIDHLLFNLVEKFPDLRFLAQVHDSLLFELPLQKAHLLKDIAENSYVDIPYNDPLRMFGTLKTSPISWGNMQPWKN